MEQLGKADLASTALRHIDAFNVARWVPYPAKSKRSGAVLGAPSADEVGPAKSRKGPNPKPLHRGCFGFFNEGATMGCDIHCYAEKRSADGKWHFVGETLREEPEDESDPGHISGGTFYSGRNYNLFSILADVRNGRGFAGVKTGEGYVPIAEPRGVPEDASDTYRAITEQWDCDGHSHSHHTLRQLLDYDWTQTTKLQGWCNAVEWSEWSRWNRGKGDGPSEYCGGVSGGNIKHVSAAEMDTMLAPVAKKYGPEREEFAKQHSNVYALAEWQEEYSTSAKEFLGAYIPRLLKLAGGTAGLDDVRIVFFFDN